MPADTAIRFTAEDSGRLDAVLAAWLAAHPVPERVFSRSQLAEAIREGRVAIGAKVQSKPSAKVQTGDRITIDLPAPQAIALTPETHAFDVLSEDADLIVVNKPAGLRVHPTPEDPTNSLVAGLLGRGIPLTTAGGVLRPGVVHRLDKTTSGVMVLAKGEAAYHGLIAAFSGRRVDKRYLALTVGHLKQREGQINAPIARHRVDRKKFTVHPAGKVALTLYAVEKTWPVGQRVALDLKTGRTHQIRVHLQHLNAPVLGDKTYGGHLTGGVIDHLSHEAEGSGYSRTKTRVALERINTLLKDYPGNCLHAQRLAFLHPVTGAALAFEAPFPAMWPLIEATLDALLEAES